MRKLHLFSAANRFVLWVLVFVLSAAFLAAQNKAAAPAKPPAEQATADDLGQTQEQLLKLLRLTPKLTMVVARDPSLLSNQQYVSQNNPELAQFLSTHPEVARNPEFYLFTRLEPTGGRAEEALERKVYADLARANDNSVLISPGDVVPFLVFLCILGALLWLVRVLLENRRWNRIFKLQTDVHGRLIEKFGTSQELLTYMETESGKRFLEAAPIPVDFKNSQAIPSPMARIITPVQIGIVLTLLGIGFLILRHSITSGAIQLLAFGTLFLMLGIGFIISAGATWALAQRLGLMPEEKQSEDFKVRQTL